MVIFFLHLENLADALFKKKTKNISINSSTISQKKPTKYAQQVNINKFGLINTFFLYSSLFYLYI